MLLDLGEWGPAVLVVSACVTARPNANVLICASIHSTERASAWRQAVSGDTAGASTYARFDRNLCWQPQRIVVYTSYLLHGECSMIVEFCRWGNSLAVRIPKAVADALKVSDGKRAEINVENGTLVLRPIVKPARKPRYTLDELLSGMTKDNVPQEVDWGPSRGNEAW
jgi:antitoxin MazE